jgi:hypothetical protein
LNWNLLAIHQAQLSQFHRETRYALDTPGLCCLSHTPSDSLASLRHDDAVNNNRLNQSSRERITGLIVIGGQRFIYPHRDIRAGFNS